MKEIDSVDEKFRPFNSMILGGKLLYEYSDRERFNFIRACLEHLAGHAGGFRYFWTDGEKDMVFGGWVEGLRVAAPLKIISTINFIIAGKYRKKDDTIPRNVVDFKCFMNTMTHHVFAPEEKKETLKLEYDSEIARKRSLEIKNLHMEKIKTLLVQGRINIKKLEARYVCS